MMMPLRAAWALTWHDCSLYLILLIYLLLSVTWNLVTPIFESPDEPDHLQYVLFVAETGRRPDLRLDINRSGIESPQPPLYYILMGGVTRISGLPTAFTHPPRNPNFDFSRVDSDVRYFMTNADNYDYVRVLRGFSTLFGLIVVVCAYLAAVMLGIERWPSLVAASLVAFLPQFTFISAAVTNDMLTSAVASITLVWLVNILRLSPPRPWQTALFGALCGFAFLGKSHVIALLPFGWLMFTELQPNGLKPWAKQVGLSLAGFFLVCGWYLIYNQIHYGDFTAVNMQTSIVPELVVRRSLLDLHTWAYLTIGLPTLLYQSFLGVFGWMRLYLPNVFYLIWGVLWLGALVGVGKGVLHRSYPRLQQLFVYAPVWAFVVVAYVNLTFTAPQGRYFFPELVVISIIFVMGVTELPLAIRRTILIAMPTFLILVNLYSLQYMANAFK
jgi:hypothetical protein